MRVTWFLLQPASGNVFDALIEGVQNDQFTSEITSGFLLDILRPDFAEGRFVERFTLVDAITDPFGNKNEVERVTYSQLSFRLSRKAPHIEIYDAPRQTHSFINRLGEFTRGTVAIYSPEISIATWLAALAAEATSSTVNRLLIADVQLDRSVQCKIALSGIEDVRGQIASVIGKRAYRISQATGRFHFKAGDVQLTVKEDCRITIGVRNEKVMPVLRKCFRSSLAEAKRNEHARGKNETPKRKKL
jgi:hypothetical protein